MASRTSIVHRAARLIVSLAAIAVLALGGAAPAGSRSAQTGDLELLVSSRSASGRSLTLIQLGSSFFSLNEPPLLSARVELSIPEGYTVDVARPVGTAIGVVFAELIEVGGNSTASAAAEIEVDNPASYAADPAAQACAPGTHAAVWLAKLKVLGQDASLPIFVDSVPGATTPRFTLRFCPMWPPPTGGPSGIGALSLGMFLEVITEPITRGRYTWSALVTPPVSGSTAPDPSRAAEVRAVVPLPQQLTLRASYDNKKKSARITGRFTVLGEPQAGARIRLRASVLGSDDFSSFGPVTTNKQGTFSVTRHVERSTRFSASAAGTTRACTAPSSAPRGCLTETVMPPDSPSATVIVPLRTDARRKINRKDQAAARRANLQLGDFPAGWTGAELDPGEPLCAGFAPNLSDLTMTGTSESPVFFTETGAGAWSSASVYLTEAHARAAFDRLARIGLLACMAKEARDENVTVNGYGPVAFPKLAEQTRAFRLRFEEQGRPLILDLVWLRVNRTVMLLFFVDVDAPLPFERELAAKVAARARNG